MGKNKKKGLTYAEAGVNIDAGEKEVELIKDCVKSTYTPGRSRGPWRIWRAVFPEG